MARGALALRPGVAESPCCFFLSNHRISVLDGWRPRSTLRAAPPAAPRAGDRRLAFRRRAALLPAAVALPRHICRMRKSDLTSQLELEKPSGKPTRQVNGIFWILLLNLAVFVVDHLLQLQQVKALYLYHRWPAWYQFVTATFCHADWNHLSSNLFFLYIFGKLVEEEEGNLGLWISYIVTGVGANLVSWLLLPRSAVSMGASGAVFGLFTISVLVKLSWDWRKILEVLILGQFVIDKVMEAARASTSLNGGLGRELYGVNHIAHFSGALIGAALILLITRVPSQSPDTDPKDLDGKYKK